MSGKGGFVETYRSVVAAWECDVMGHLTIAYYFDRFSDAAFNLIDALAPAAAPPGAAWRSSQLLVKYERELRAGDGMFIRSGVIGKDGDTLRLGHELVKVGTNDVATLVEHTLTPCELPYGALSEQRRILAKAIIPWNSPGFEEGPTPAHDERMIETGRDRVKANETDERGALSLAGYVHRFAYACLHICAGFGMTPDYMRAAKRGFSTFETRLHLAEATPNAGEGVIVRSGLLRVGKSSLHMLHELRDARSGETFAFFFQSGVHFDLEERRSAPLPDELREKAERLVIT